MNSGYNTTLPLDFQKAKEIGFKLLETDKQMALYWLLGIYTGCRIGDILALKWNDIPEGKVLYIKEGKTKKKRIIIISEPLRKVLDLFENKKGFLFANKNGNIISREWINKKIKKILLDNNLPFKNQSSHMLRKTFATEIHRKSKDIFLVQKMLNHSTPAVTLRYIGITENEIKQAYDFLD